MADKDINEIVFPVKVNSSFSEEVGANPRLFWAKVNVAGPDDCWEWMAAKDSNGYGRFALSTSRNAAGLAHRVAFGMVHGYLPEAVCHKCDNPKCCNPHHLFGGTRADNNRDMHGKGRAAARQPKLQGEKHHMAKLTVASVMEIKAEYGSGGITQYQLADKYGVSQRTIAKAIHGLHVGFGNA